MACPVVVTSSPQDTNASCPHDLPRLPARLPGLHLMGALLSGKMEFGAMIEVLKCGTLSQVRGAD
jgi:hypothetical protein